MPAINDMNDEIYEQAHTVLNDLPEQPTVVEQGIALSVQREFLEYAEGIDLNQYSQEDIRARGRSLFDPDTTLEDKKKGTCSKDWWRFRIHWNFCEHLVV